MCFMKTANTVLIIVSVAKLPIHPCSIVAHRSHYSWVSKLISESNATFLIIIEKWNIVYLLYEMTCVYLLDFQLVQISQILLSCISAAHCVGSTLILFDIYALLKMWMKFAALIFITRWNSFVFENVLSCRWFQGIL